MCGAHPSRQRPSSVTAAWGGRTPQLLHSAERTDKIKTSGGSHGMSPQDVRGARRRRRGLEELSRLVMVKFQLTRMPITSEPCREDFRPNKFLSLNHDRLAGIARSTGRYKVYNPNVVCENMCKKNRNSGYFDHRISLPLPCGRGPASRLFRCSGLSSYSCFLLLPRSDPFGLPNWSPFGISYARKGQTLVKLSKKRLLTGGVQHWKVELNLILVKIVLDRGQRSRWGPHLRRYR